MKNKLKFIIQKGEGLTIEFKKLKSKPNKDIPQELGLR